MENIIQEYANPLALDDAYAASPKVSFKFPYEAAFFFVGGVEGHNSPLVGLGLHIHEVLFFKITHNTTHSR